MGTGGHRWAPVGHTSVGRRQKRLKGDRTQETQKSQKGAKKDRGDQEKEKRSQKGRKEPTRAAKKALQVQRKKALVPCMRCSWREDELDVEMESKS